MWPPCDSRLLQRSAIFVFLLNREFQQTAAKSVHLIVARLRLIYDKGTERRDELLSRVKHLLPAETVQDRDARLEHCCRKRTRCV